MIPIKKSQGVVLFSDIGTRREGRVVRVSFRLDNDSIQAPFYNNENGIVACLFQYFVHATLANYFKRNLSEDITFSLKMTDLSTTRNGFEIELGIGFMFVDRSYSHFLGQQTQRLLAFEENTIFVSMTERFSAHFVRLKELLLEDYTRPDTARRTERRHAYDYVYNGEEDAFPENATRNFEFFEFNKFFNFREGYSSYLELLSEIYRWHADGI